MKNAVCRNLRGNMSTRVRVWSVVATVAAWAAWLAAFTASKVADVGWAHMAATELLRSLAMIGTIVCVILWLVAPVIATARVWHRIGMEEQQKRCRACPESVERAARYSNIIPIDF